VGAGLYSVLRGIRDRMVAVPAAAGNYTYESRPRCDSELVRA